MKKFCLAVGMVLSLCRVFAQDTARVAPYRQFFNTDLVYDVESIPSMGYEQFFTHKGKLRSWFIDARYQVHYNDQFGFVFSHGDKVSIGVYQGPVLKAGKNIYRSRPRKHWLNYYSYSAAFKYLWYSSERVNTGHRISDVAYRIQSEQCMAVVPQFVIGAKRANKHFCADFYCGLQVHVKLRDKTIELEQNSNGTVNLHVPYTSDHTTFAPAPVAGIRLGYIR